MMDKDNLAIINRKRARGAILGALDNSYPTQVAYRSMENALAASNICQRHELPGLLRYLEDKEYIRITTPEEPELRPLENCLLALSARGVDLLEGTLPEDLGIII